MAPELKYVIKLCRYEGPTAQAGSTHIPEGSPPLVTGLCQGVIDLQGVQHTIENVPTTVLDPLQVSHPLTKGTIESAHLQSCMFVADVPTHKLDKYRNT